MAKNIGKKEESCSQFKEFNKRYNEKGIELETAVKEADRQSNEHYKECTEKEIEIEGLRDESEKIRAESLENEKKCLSAKQ